MDFEVSRVRTGRVLGTIRVEDSTLSLDGIIDEADRVALDHFLNETPELAAPSLVELRASWLGKQPEKRHFPRLSREWFQAISERLYTADYRIVET